MKRQRTLILYLILILTEFAAVQRPLYSQDIDIRELYKKALPAVVNILVADKKGEEIGGGTGFFIGPGKILTAAHIVENAFTLCVTSASIPAEKLNCKSKITLLNKDVINDLALLEVEPVNMVSLSLDSDLSVEPGQPVLAIGNTSDYENLFSSGIVRGTSDSKILSTFVAGPGFSGGPLLNENGKVIGIHKGSYMHFSNDVNALKIQQFLEARVHPRRLPPFGSVVPESKNIFSSIWRKSSGFVSSIAGPVVKWLWKASGRFVQIVGVVVLVGLILLALLIFARLAAKAAYSRHTPAFLMAALVVWIVILKLSPDLMAPIMVKDTLFWLFFVIPSFALIFLPFAVIHSLRIRRRLKEEAVKAKDTVPGPIKHSGRRYPQKRHIPRSSRKAG